MGNIVASFWEQPTDADTSGASAHPTTEIRYASVTPGDRELRSLHVFDRGAPTAILVSQLNSDDAAIANESLIQIIQCLFDRGYAVLSTEGCAELERQIHAVFALGQKYFQADLAVKQQAGSRDPLSGHMLNMGFVNVPGKREYIKLRPCEEADMWPVQPPEFADTFKALLQSLYQISWKCFLQLASSTIELEKEGQREGGRLVKEGEEGREGGGKFRRRLIPQNNVEAIAEFAEKKSSLSLIHYVEQKEGDKGEDDEEEGGEDKQEAEKEKEKEVERQGEGDITARDKHSVCGLHRDTGILTLGVASDIHGLEMYDRKLKAWVKVEACTRPGDLVLFVGEKVPLFTGVNTFPASPHRVMLPHSMERYTMVFLLDIAK